jgi:hypothetical protein
VPDDDNRALLVIPFFRARSASSGLLGRTALNRSYCGGYAVPGWSRAPLFLDVDVKRLVDPEGLGSWHRLSRAWRGPLESKFF